MTQRSPTVLHASNADVNDSLTISDNLFLIFIAEIFLGYNNISQDGKTKDSIDKQPLQIQEQSHCGFLDVLVEFSWLVVILERNGDVCQKLVKSSSAALNNNNDNPEHMCQIRPITLFFTWSTRTFREL